MMATIQKSDIEWLAPNRPRDLHDLLMGTSAYTQDVSDSFSECDDESDWTLVIHHLLFAEQFGAAARNTKGEWKGERYYPSHREVFDGWLVTGMSGLHHAELYAYLVDNPVG